MGPQELDRGEGTSCQGSPRTWARNGEKFAEENHARNTPPLGTPEGAARRGSGGEARDTRYSRDVRGGSESQHTSTHTKREVTRKRERKMDGHLERDPGTPWLRRAAPVRRAVAERPALHSGPAPSFLWAAGW